jgi:hypothetical protein
MADAGFCGGMAAPGRGDADESRDEVRTLGGNSFRDGGAGNEAANAVGDDMTFLKPWRFLSMRRPSASMPDTRSSHRHG